MLRIRYYLAELIYRAGNLFLRGLTAILYLKKTGDPRRVAVVRTGNLGDTFCSIPALRALKERYPKADLILVTSEDHENELHPINILKGIFSFSSHICFNLSRLRNPRYLFNFVKTMRTEKIDLIVYLGYSIKLKIIIRDAIFYRIAGCQSAVGFVWDRHGFFRISQRNYKKFDNTVERLMKLLQPLKIDPKIVKWEIPLPSSPIDLSINMTKPVIAIHPAAKFPAKRWPLEKFVRVVRRLQGEPAPLLVIIGGPEAVKEAEVLAEATGRRGINLCGKTDFIELADILRRCDMLLSPDSGPIHVAAAVGTPVVGLYSALDYPGRWYPHGNNHIIIRKDVSCQICFLTDCPTMKCMDEITVDEVVDACHSVLGKRER